VLYQASAGNTTRMTNGAVGTVLTSGGVGAVPSWQANLAGNAGSSTYASNTTVVNDAASATSHALTFVSNISGNLPIKTRANVGTGAGLTYVPSTNVLTVNAAGVGTVSTAKIAFTNNLGELAEINNGGGVVAIINRDPSNQTIIQTADSAGTVASRVSVTDVNTTIYNKLQTDAGIIGPATALSYATNMIGYTTGKVVGNGVTAVIVNNVWGTVTTTGFTFPAIGIWAVTISCYHDKSAAAGNLVFQNIGLGLSATVLPTGQGTFTATSNSTASQPAVVGYLVGVTTNIITITSTAFIYYVVYQANFTGSVFTKAPLQSYYVLTRIA
jgi:hypothetical protein